MTEKEIKSTRVLTVDKGALTVEYAKSPIRESDELQAAIAALS